MNEKKPSVFPQNGLVPEKRISDLSKDELEAFNKEKEKVIEEILTPEPEARLDDAIELMKQRTKEQIKLRDQALENNKSQTSSYNNKYQEAMDRGLITPIPEVVSTNLNENRKEPPQPTMKSEELTPTKNSVEVDDYIKALSQPNFNTSFDVIPLPSEGKLYRSKKSNVRVAYLTTGDEDILTSPNILESGQFLEILINRKLLEPEIRFKDLHIGDRNAIMLWLRATSYGEMYPITILDENDMPFDTEINLHDLKVKKLGAEPDAEGLIDFICPLSKALLKIKLLTVSDVDSIEEMLVEDKKNKELINRTNTYKLRKHIIEVNGVRDRASVNAFIESMRIADGKALNNFIEDIDSGIDLNVTVPTPGGGSVTTFLPLSLKFFWPDL